MDTATNLKKKKNLYYKVIVSPKFLHILKSMHIFNMSTLLHMYCYHMNISLDRN